jgi:regulator of sigma E protease
MNFVLAFLVALILTAFFAQAPMGNCFLYDVTEGSPAMEAGLQPGDAIVSIDGENVQKLSAQEVVARIGSGGEDKPVNFVILRDGQEMPVSVSLRYDEAEGRSIIGVMVSETYGKIGIGRIIPEAWNMCTFYGGAIVRALGALITTGEGLQDSAGPIGIVQMVSEQTRQYGILAYLELLVFISINLGLMNLLPIPGLDGSRLVFHLIEAVIGKPVNRKVETIIYLIGYAFLIGLMVFFTFKDVMRLFGK